MILRKMTLTNFRQILGRNEIQFAPAGDRNVTVLLGENGSGKSTLLNAFLWCLYGRVELENPEEVLCHKAVEEAAIGAQVDVEVTLVFDAHGSTYSVMRRLGYVKKDGGEIEQRGDEDFRVDVVRENGETSPEKDPIQAVSQLLPDQLSGFFFFRGEDMEALARQHSAGRLKDGVESFLDFSIIDNAIKHLQQVAGMFDADLGKVATGAAKEISEKIAQVKEELRDATVHHDGHQANVQSLEAQIDDIDRQLSEYREVQPLVDRKKVLVTERKVLEDEITNRRRDLAEVISRDGFLLPKSTALRTPLELADAAVERGELPAKIKPQFVDDLIQLGECICGHPIDEAMHKALMEWKANTGLADIEAAVNQMRTGIRSLKGREERGSEQLVERRAALATSVEGLNLVVGEYSDIQSKLEGKDFGIENLASLQAALRTINSDLVEAKVHTTREFDFISRLQERLDGLNDDRKEKTREQEQAHVLQQRFDAVETVRKTLVGLRVEWSGLVQKYTDTELKAMWAQVAQLDRMVEFTPDFHLTVKERGGDGAWRPSASSSANLRAVSLCFISALIQLASTMEGDQDDRSPGAFFRGGKYPLVMDAPFAHMGHYFKSTVPARLREVVPQVVIISSHDQWEDEVEDSLRGYVGAAYVLVLHRPGDIDSSSSIKLLGDTVDYVVPAIGEELDWSIISEVQT